MSIYVMPHHHVKCNHVFSKKITKCNVWKSKSPKFQKQQLRTLTEIEVQYIHKYRIEVQKLFIFQDLFRSPKDTLYVQES